jgi:hypothetical protein
LLQRRARLFDAWSILAMPNSVFMPVATTMAARARK